MKQKAAGIYGSNAIRLKMVTDRKVIVQVTEIKYFGNGISRIKKDVDYKCEHLKG
jgi:hypothetical protein